MEDGKCDGGDGGGWWMVNATEVDGECDRGDGECDGGGDSGMVDGECNWETVNAGWR